MTLVRRWKPFSAAVGHQDQIDQVFDEMWRRSRAGSRTGAWFPPVDVSENELEFRVVAELPGISKDNVKITLNDGVLTLRGEKPTEVKSENETRHHVERTFGVFERSFRLSAPVDKEKITARFENGVLRVVLPKSEESRPREISIDS